MHNSVEFVNRKGNVIMIEKKKTACFSGHRKLPKDCAELRENLEKAIISLIDQGVIFFGSGGALGFDQIAAETVLKLKGNYSYVKLVMILPCPPEEQSLRTCPHRIGAHLFGKIFRTLR